MWKSAKGEKAVVAPELQKYEPEVDEEKEALKKELNQSERGREAAEREGGGEERREDAVRGRKEAEDELEALKKNL